MRARSIFLALVLVPPALAGSLRADTVVLANGQKYEDVIAERTPQGVTVQLAFGQITLSSAQVKAIEKSPSSTAEYLRRKAELTARPQSRASDWLELARWAKVHDQSSGAREAALTAAALDPHLPGLDAMLRPLGMVYDDGAGRWMTFEDSMTRRGLVRYDGEWMSPGERRDRMAEDARRREAEAQADAARRMASAAEAMQRTQILAAQQQAARDQQAAASDFWPGYPVYAGAYAPWGLVVTMPGFPPSHHGHHDGDHDGHHDGHDGHHPSGSFDWNTFATRPPGSLLPPMTVPQQSTGTRGSGRN